MANLDEAFTVSAISFNDELGIFYGDDDPSIVGYEAPIGSIYIQRSVGKIFQKQGSDDYAWLENQTSGGSSGGNIDGGRSNSIYLVSQNLDGGHS